VPRGSTLAVGRSSLGRILFLSSNFPRWENDATTPFILDLAQDLQRLGWSIDVLVPHAPGAATDETIGGIHVERFRYFWPETQQTICYGGGALANLRNNPADKLKLPCLVMCEWAALRRRLRRGDYDLLHSHWILPQGFVAALAAPMAGIPHVATIHGSDVFALNNPILNRLKAFALRRADAVTANSSATRRAGLELAPDLARLQTIPMGVSDQRAPDPGRVASLRAQYRKKDGPLLLFAGRLVFEKGLDDLIVAMDVLTQSLPSSTALLIGDGPDRAALETELKRRGLDDRVGFAGWVPSDTLTDYYAAGDIIVAPSRFEAQGLAIAEAMLAGRAVIATDVGGVGDTVHHEQTGLLVRERSPDEIAAAVLRLHGDRDLALRLAAAGRAYVKANLMRSQTAAAFGELFKATLADRAQRAGTMDAGHNTSLELGSR